MLLIFQSDTVISALFKGSFLVSFFSQEHSRCYSSCSFTHTENNRTLTFDLRPMSDVASLIIGPSFTSKGTKYLHLFNISLCGHEVTVHFIYRTTNHDKPGGSRLLLCFN